MRQAFGQKEEMKGIKSGIMGILFNREKREARDKGTANSILAREMMIQDYVKQYEDQLKDNTITFVVARNGAYDAIPFNKFNYVVEYVATQIGGEARQYLSEHPRKPDVIQNIIIDKLKLSDRSLAFSDYRLAGPTFAHLI